jgi:hypothetical protein
MISFTQHKKGLKLGGFLSINVNPKFNDYCNRCHKNKKSICSQCYAFYMINRYPRLFESTRKNAIELSERILSPEELKPIADKVNRKKGLYGLRFNSLGELINDIHVYNLQLISSKIDIRTPVTLWTKRPGLLFKVIDRPFFRVIRSAPLINTYLNPEKEDKRIDHTFNVYDNPEKMHKDIKKLNDIGVNTFICHGSCRDCMHCYKAPYAGCNQSRSAIFELTKKTQRKIIRGEL